MPVSGRALCRGLVGGLIGVLVGTFIPGAGQAQDFAFPLGRSETMPSVSSSSQEGLGVVQVPILTVDWEQLYQRSAWAQRVRQEIARESAALTRENDRIADDLIEEERALTERRATMTPQDFRVIADAFDEKATSIRNAQAAKAQVLNRQLDTERQTFLQQMQPLLEQLLVTRGSFAILDRRAIIYARDAVDVTDELVALVDTELGSGPVSPDQVSPDEAPLDQAPPEAGADTDAAPTGLPGLEEPAASGVPTP